MKKVIGSLAVILLILALAACSKGAPSEISEKFYAYCLDAITLTDNYLNGAIDAGNADDLLDAICSGMKREEENCPSPSFAMACTAKVSLIETYVFTSSLSISTEPKDDEILKERNELAKKINYKVAIGDAPGVDQITIPEPGVDFSLMDDYDYTGWQDEGLLGLGFKAPAGTFLEEQSNSEKHYYMIGESVIFGVSLMSYDPELGPEYYYNAMKAAFLEDDEGMTNEIYKNDFLEGWQIEGVRIEVVDGSVKNDYIRAAEFVVNDELYLILCIVNSDADNKYFTEWEMFLASFKPL
ncbi:MAG: hypothetical protein FWG03_06300 [Clostridiales bacterium]|nr:hypothetical protein [Clostridiales bacterium]